MAVIVSEIHCLKMETQERFSSVLRLPPGHSAPPVLEEAPSSLPGCQVSSQSCKYFCDGVLIFSVQIAGTTLQGVYLVELGQLEQCGVRECEEQGELWLCLLVR